VTGRDDHDTHDEHADPTGVRAILAALPDPGPMPVEVVERIIASLAAEQTGSSTTDTAPVDPAERRPIRERHFGARLPSLALAASVVVLAGAVLFGVLTLTGRLSIGSSTTASAGDSTSMDAAGADAGREATSAEQYAAPEAEEATADGSEEAAEDPSAPVQPMSVAAAPVFASNVDLTAGTLTAHAAALRARALDPQDHQLEGLPSASPISSPAGAADCLGIILDADSAGIVSRLMAIDFVDYDGASAAMLLLRDAEPGPRAGDGRNEPVTAYLVPADCGLTEPRTLTDPIRLDS